MGDLGTYEREFTLGLQENEEHTLGEIAAALGRIEQGTFGHCDGCRKAIPKDRLNALPYARYCVGCARRVQA
jgi:RNA polymerase-binding transcription factor DksA